VRVVKEILFLIDRCQIIARVLAAKNGRVETEDGRLVVSGTTYLTNLDGFADKHRAVGSTLSALTQQKLVLMILIISLLPRASLIDSMREAVRSDVAARLLPHV